MVEDEADDIAFDSGRRGERLRVGVIGLGRLWESRHKPALRAMPDKFEIVAVYDQVARRAWMEARQLGCEAAQGLRAMIGRPDLDAVYLMEPQWFGWHAMELAALHRKPVYCALNPAADPARFEEVAARFAASGAPFMIELARRYYPATLRLLELIATTLGPVRTILGRNPIRPKDRRAKPGPGSPFPINDPVVDPGVLALDWIRYLGRGAPARLNGFHALIESGAEPHELCALAIQLDNGVAGHVAVTRRGRKVDEPDANSESPARFEVQTEFGRAVVDLPNRIEWTSGGGQYHKEILDETDHLGPTLNDHFARLIRGQQTLAPTLRDAVTLARLVREIHRLPLRGVPIDLGDVGAGP